MFCTPFESRQIVPYTIEQGVPNWKSILFWYQEATNCATEKEQNIACILH